MNRLFGKLTDEWEKTACWIAAAVMVAFVLTWINPGNDGKTTGSGRKPPKQTLLLSREAFNFMERMPDAGIKGANPLCFRYVPPATARPWKRPSKSPSRWTTSRPKTTRPKTTTKTPPKRLRPTRLRPRTTTPKVTPAVPPRTTTKTPTAPPKAPTAKPTVPKTVPAVPPKPPQKREIVFCGLMKTLSGKTVAQVQVHDPATKKKVLDFWTPGAQVQGLKIQSITDSAIEVSDPTGKAHTISLGNENKKSITFE